MLKTLEVIGPLQGYGIARRTEQISAMYFCSTKGSLRVVAPSVPATLDLVELGAL
jgi:hypothetical protein